MALAVTSFFLVGCEVNEADKFFMKTYYNDGEIVEEVTALHMSVSAGLCGRTTRRKEGRFLPDMSLVSQVIIPDKFIAMHGRSILKREIKAWF